MPQDVLEALLRLCPTIDEDGAQDIKCGIASNPGASLKLLSLLAQDEDSNVRHGLKTNPQAPQCALRACFEMYGVDSDLAENSNTPQDILEVCAHNEDLYTREAVARNQSSSADILNLLANDPNESVRGTVAENPNTPQEILERLSFDESEHVRSCVAKNPSITNAISEKLVTDENSVLEGLALNLNVSTEILDRLAKNEDECIRIYVAGNRGTKPETLGEMVTSPCGPLYAGIVTEIAENPNTPPRLLRFLSKELGSSIRVFVARNPKIAEVEA